MVIWKFPLAMVHRQSVEMPKGAQVLSVHGQRPNPDLDGTICLWAVCRLDAPKVARHFAIVGTGNPMPSGLGKFIGTVLMPPFVRHVFECE